VWWACYFDEHGRRHRERVGPKGLAVKVYQKRKKSTLRALSDWTRIGQCWKDAPETKGKTLRQIESRDVERYREHQRARGAAEGTCNRHLTFLRSVYNLAIRDGTAETNPVRADLFFKENNQRLRYLTDEEEPRLRAALGEEEWPKLAVALNTGLRQSNEFHLKWSDVNFDAGTITVRRSKSGQPYHVPMNDDVRAALRDLPSRLRSEWIFPSDTGKTALDAKNYMHRVFNPALKKARITGFRWHDLRHTFATRLVMAGVDIRTVQELMGHRTIAMTLRYAHLSPAHRLDAVQRLSRPVDATPPLLPPTSRPRRPRLAPVRKWWSYRRKRVGGAGIEPATPGL